MAHATIYPNHNPTSTLSESIINKIIKLCNLFIRKKKQDIKEHLWRAYTTQKIENSNNVKRVLTTFDVV